MRLRRSCRIVAALMLAVCAGCAGAPPLNPGYAFDTTPGRLPKDTLPVRYAIDLSPDLDAKTFTGEESVEIDVRRPTPRIVLNAADLTVSAVELADEPKNAAEVAADPASQTVTFTFPQPLSAGAHKLHLRFSGRINPYARGLYFADYPTAEGRKRMIGTQLEPADARRIFPCWDEPAFKAAFELSVTVPSRFMAVSNMPVAHETALDPGHKRVSFVPTPRMSSYLVVLAAGELERVTAEADGVTVGVVTTSGKTAQGRFALESAQRLLTYYDDYFGVKYPLPKLDLIAIPGGFPGAMENWGGITFFESRLLFDPAGSPPALRREVFSILAHEMAHLWFGDLVTTAWWDNLWLNEGFASWMQAKAAELLHPEWEVWLHSAGSKRYAMREDAKRTSHPIQQPVADESEAMSAFDGITYNKGQAFIRMLEAFLGEDVFRAGVQRYMREHAYSNATTADLWSALDAVSRQPVTDIAARYTEQPGVPLVISSSSCVGGTQQIQLAQSRYALHDPEASALHWRVPVTLGPVPGGPPRTLLLDGAAQLDGGPCGTPIKLNLGGIGYYHVSYDAGTRAALLARFETLAPADQINLLDDLWALVEADQAPAAGVLEVIDGLPVASHQAVWSDVLQIASRIDFLERGRPGRAAFQAYIRSRLRPVFDRLGWQPRAGEPEDDTMLRASLIDTLGWFGDPQIVAEAKRRFASYLRRPSSLPPSLKDPVSAVVGRGADTAMYDRLLALARAATSTEDRVRYYNALAAARDPALARRTLALALSDELPSSLASRLIFGVAAAGEHPDLAWSFLRANFAALIERQSPQFGDYAAAGLLSNFSDPARATELEQFAPAHATSGGRIESARAVETILINADFVARQLPAIDAWIARRAGHS
ncbi:MAG TPA: M1 family metallopeptidase [Alphaproteobacteria bacterium]|nr:M1 family metallopeptidase [Alphaproteobacteria bacterium]